MFRKQKLCLSTALFLAIAIVVTFTPSAFAAAPDVNIGAVRADVLHLSKASKTSSITLKPSAKPFDTQTCWNVSMQVARTGTNTFTVHGIASFFCGLTNGGGLSVTAPILCPVASGNSGSSRLNFPAGIKSNPSYAYQTSFVGFCEGCENHVPTTFPFFSMAPSAYAYSYVLNAGAPVNDPASYSTLVEGFSQAQSVGLPNSPAYTIPC